MWGRRSFSNDNHITLQTACIEYYRLLRKRQLPYNLIEHNPLTTITMSNETFAAFRKTHGDQLGKLAEEHFNKDLEDTDRETLKVAAAKFSSHAAIGSLIGISLGALLAFRVRSARTKVFNAFKAREKPVSVSFADGRTGMSIHQYMKISTC